MSEDEPLSTRRSRVSIRLSLLVVVPSLVVATGVAIAVGAFSSTRAAVDELAADRFRGASQSAADRARTHLLRAVPAIETAPLVYVDDGTDRARRLALSPLPAGWAGVTVLDQK